MQTAPTTLPPALLEYAIQSTNKNFVSSQNQSSPHRQSLPKEYKLKPKSPSNFPLHYPFLPTPTNRPNTDTPLSPPTPQYIPRYISNPFPRNSDKPARNKRLFPNKHTSPTAISAKPAATINSRHTNPNTGSGFPNNSASPNTLAPFAKPTTTNNNPDAGTNQR